MNKPIKFLIVLCLVMGIGTFCYYNMQAACESNGCKEPVKALICDNHGTVHYLCYRHRVLEWNK